MLFGVILDADSDSSSSSEGLTDYTIDFSGDSIMRDGYVSQSLLPGVGIVNANGEYTLLNGPTNTEINLLNQAEQDKTESVFNPVPLDMKDPRDQLFNQDGYHNNLFPSPSIIPSLPGIPSATYTMPIDQVLSVHMDNVNTDQTNSNIEKDVKTIVKDFACKHSHFGRETTKVIADSAMAMSRLKVLQKGLGLLGVNKVIDNAFDEMERGCK